MIYLPRVIETTLKKHLSAFPIVAVTGPRQAGKSTLLQQTLSDYHYVTFDDPNLREFLHMDPEGFMKTYSSRVIFDEAQLAPALFSYLKIYVDRPDNRSIKGQFVLTGSSQFHLLSQITETLAGRVGLLSLLPLEYSELPDKEKPLSVYRGSYPELVCRHYEYSDAWFSSYINTYLERDIRGLHNVGDLVTFQRFIKLLSAQVSAPLNMSQYAKDIGVSVPTIKRWISMLEASYIIFLLPPYFNNLSKRVIKTPKVYFYDSGLVAYLTGLIDQTVYERSPLKGALFENEIISQIIKKHKNRALPGTFYFYRTHEQSEVDMIIDFGTYRHWIEIKSTATFESKMTKTLLAQMQQQDEGFILYQGDEKPFHSRIKILPYFKYLKI